MWTKFTKALPESFKDIWTVLSKEGLTPILIGGVPRDYLLTGVVGDDWDMELTHNSFSFDTGLWKRLGKSLSSFGQVQFLPFDIIRLKTKDTTYEFSAPRSEVFPDNWESGGHKNFEAKLNLKMPFDEAVRRRDFTINSIGLKFSSFDKVECLDPLNGTLHLREKLLVSAGVDFKKDPIRFFRAIRFSIKLGFEFAPELLETLKSMPLENISATHVWSEVSKSGDIKKFFQKVNTFKSFSWAPTIASDDSLKKSWQESPAKLMLWLALKGYPVGPFSSFFNLSPKDTVSFERLGEGVRVINKLDPMDFHGEFDEVRELASFETICDVYFSLKNMQSREAQGFVVELLKEFAPSWQYLFSFDVIKDVRDIDPPLRARYQVWNLCQKL